MKVKFFAPSYKRPQKSRTQILYPFVKLVVMESEEKAYRDQGNDVEVCPDPAQGNLCRVRNWILDNLFTDCDSLVLLDDDNYGIGRWEDQEFVTFGEDELMEFSEEMGILCKEWGFYFWGLNCAPNKQFYREHTPFGTIQYIGGPFQGWIKGNKLRYDERLSLKEDYDMTLQNVWNYGGCLRVNYASYRNKQSEQAGGCSMQRNLDEEKRQFNLLQRKWGSDVISRDYKSKRSFDYNPILRIPIRGV